MRGQPKNQRVVEEGGVLLDTLERRRKDSRCQIRLEKRDGSCVAACCCGPHLWENRGRS